MLIEPFSPENLDHVEKMVTDVWGSPDHRPEFDHAFCGHLARYNYLDPELSFQIVDEEGIQGVCWASVPGQTNDAEAWVGKAVIGLTDEECKETFAHVTYLKSIDAAVCRMMGPKDVKISFLITQKRGGGAALLKHVMKVLSERGFENVFLWTDSSCKPSASVSRGNRHRPAGLQSGKSGIPARYSHSMVAGGLEEMS